MSSLAGPSVLLCTDTISGRFGDRIAAAAPGLGIIAMRHGDDLIPIEDLSRVDVAFFSGDAWPTISTRFWGAVLRAPNLRWLHTFSAGVDDPIFASLHDRGVRISTSSGAAAAPIARTVVMYLLALSRDLPRLLRAQADHTWATGRFDDIAGQTIGVLGMGPIGREVIRMTTALGMHPIGMRRAVTGDEPCETWPIRRLVELASAVDVLVVALPLTDDTRSLVSAEVIAAMRPGAVFVNVGRGEVVDEVALTEALTTGHLGGAGLDVFAVEPLPVDSALWDLPNVIVTPHNSGLTQQSEDMSVELFLANLAAYVRGEPLKNEFCP